MQSCLTQILHQFKSILSLNISLSTVKCFQHAEEEAVGVCKKCARGICTGCALGIGWDIYCKSYIEKSAQILGKGRGSTITTASVILYILGAVEVITSFVLLLLLSNTAYSILPYMGVAVGIAILGIAYFLPAKLLWTAKQKDSPLCDFSYYI